jgi:nitroimidazol reductase NimA-like FMN-containing flavoprotein (pyridoxamine 5'-phosphate oxidase superfamily)
VSEKQSDPKAFDSGRRMTGIEREAYLALGVTCRLGCLDNDGYPYVVPVWFQHADGGFYIVARERSIWAGYLERDGRVSLCIDGGTEQPNARVLVKGIAEIVERPNVGGRWVDLAREMSIRYNGRDRGLAYLESTLNEPRWLFFVRPVRVMDWVGSWAKKYKHSDW